MQGGMGGVCYPPEGYEIVSLLWHSRKGVLWMVFVQVIVLVIVVAVAIIVYPKKDTFIDKVKFKGSFKSFELEISAKQKNCPPVTKDSSNQENWYLIDFKS